MTPEQRNGFGRRDVDWFTHPIPPDPCSKLEHEGLPQAHALTPA